MLIPFILIFSIVIVIYGLASRKYERSGFTAPMAFLGAGILLGLLLKQETEIELELLLLVGEIALVLTLFSDASRINLRELRGNGQLPGRMLVIALPLIIVAGMAAGVAVLTELTFLEAAILAAVLAPTDAGLGEPVVNNKRVPVRIRQALNVESGLNDGIVVPILTFLLALVATEATLEPAGFWIGFALTQIVGGAIVGIVVGVLGGWMIKQSIQRGWMNKIFQHLAFPAFALIAWSAADLLGGNGFIAAFVGGLATALAFGRVGEDVEDFIEIEGRVLILLLFFIFGALTANLFENFNGAIVLYAVLSLTVVRMLPIAISMVGLKLRGSSILFLGWFGPRGLASIVLGMIVLEHAVDIPGFQGMLAALAATVVLSVFAHGLSAIPLIDRYSSRTEEMEEEAPEKGAVGELPSRKKWKEGQPAES